MGTKSRLTLTQLTKQQRNLKDETDLKNNLQNTSQHSSWFVLLSIAFQTFHDVAYAADTREQLLGAIDDFLEDVVVLPPGNWDRNVLLPILIAQSRAIAVRRKMAKAGRETKCTVRGRENPFNTTCLFMPFVVECEKYFCI